LQPGTSLYYAPGALNGGVVEHECSLQRSMGYFLELVLYMAPFMKTTLELRLKGVTNDRDDPSVTNSSIIDNSYSDYFVN
jgi:RNA 3'-terminal phosphate cyclase-like protein